MSNLKDIIAYYCDRYPHKDELSKARLTKMVYLADWKSAITRGEQISNIKWIYNHYGPYVDDVTHVAQSDPLFHVESTTNMFGKDKEVVRLRSENYTPFLTEDEKRILDHIIKVTHTRYWNDFMELVYSTYPIIKSEKYTDLDLVKFAKEYKNSE